MNGMMKMADAQNVYIPAHGKAVFEPGGYHMMLVNINKPIKPGDIVPITLHFQGDHSLMVKAQVKSQEDDDSSSPVATSMPKMKM